MTLPNHFGQLDPGTRAALDQARAHLADIQTALTDYQIACSVIDSLEKSENYPFTPQFARILAVELLERYGEK